MIQATSLELGKYAFMSDKSYERILQDVIGLLAYTDPFDSPLASFMSQARRIEVADKLNSHILGKSIILSTRFI